VVRLCRAEVSSVDAVVRLVFDLDVDANVAFRTDHTNASISSRMTE
jgi:hypothetical protein